MRKLKKTLASLAAAGTIAAGGVIATAPAAQAEGCSETARSVQYDYRYVKQNWVGLYYRDSVGVNCDHHTLWQVGMEYKKCRVLKRSYQVKNNQSRGYIHYRCPKGEYWRYSKWVRM